MANEPVPRIPPTHAELVEALRGLISAAANELYSLNEHADQGNDDSAEEADALEERLNRARSVLWRAGVD